MARKKVDVVDLKRLTPDEVRAEADRGNPEALDLYRNGFAVHPEVCRSLGNLAIRVRESRLHQIFGNGADVSKLATWETMNAMERELAGANPTPSQTLLIDRIVTCWLDVHCHELRYSRSMDASSGEHERWARMLDRAHHRFLTAIKGLTDARRPNRPPVQVNIADKQINTLGIRASDVSQGNRLGD